jgi:hypothetical protein
MLKAALAGYLLSLGEFRDGLRQRAEAFFRPELLDREACQQPFGRPCAAWYDASDASTLVLSPLRWGGGPGAELRAWKDKSGNRLHLTPQEGWPAPLVVQPGAAARLLFGAGMTAAASPAEGWTACVVASNVTSSQPLWSVNDREVASPRGFAEARVLCAAEDPSAGSWELYSDGALVEEARSALNQSSARYTLQLGRGAAWSAHELVLFEGRLSALEVARASSALLAKWAPAPPPLSRLAPCLPGNWTYELYASLDAEPVADGALRRPASPDFPPGQPEGLMLMAYGAFAPALPGSHAIAWRVCGSDCSLWLQRHVAAANTPMLQASQDAWQQAVVQLSGPVNVALLCARVPVAWELSLIGPDNRPGVLCSTNII